MNAKTAKNLKVRELLRTRSRNTRATRKAQRQVATVALLPAKTRLVAAGLDPQLAKRFAGAFSNGTAPTATSTTVIKLKGRRTKKVPVKLYDLAAFTRRLAAYRPKDKVAAAKFEAVAYRLAA